MHMPLSSMSTVRVCAQCVHVGWSTHLAPSESRVYETRPQQCDTWTSLRRRGIFVEIVLTADIINHCLRLLLLPNCHWNARFLVHEKWVPKNEHFHLIAILPREKLGQFAQIQWIADFGTILKQWSRRAVDFVSLKSIFFKFFSTFQQISSHQSSLTGRQHDLGGFFQLFRAGRTDIHLHCSVGALTVE